MKIRNAIMVLAAMCATLLVAPVAASAASTPGTTGTSFTNLPVTGKAHNKKAFKGHFTVTQFVTKNGTTYAVGTLTGKVGSRAIKSRQVSLPVALPGTTKTMGAKASTICPVLHLNLGPLNLNLLGLKVHLNPIVLDITAVSGPGNLLGNLLCDLSNLLNTTPATGASLTGVLNIVQQLVNTPGLLKL